MEGRGCAHAARLHTVTDDNPAVLVGDFYVDISQANSTCLVSSVVERFGLACYADSTMPTTWEGNRELMFVH